MVLLAVTSGIFEVLILQIDRLIAQLSWKKIEKFIFITGLVLCATVYDNSALDVTLTPRHVIWAIYTAFLVVSITARALEDPSKINFGIIKQPLFLVFAGYIVFALISMTQAVNLSEAFYGFLLIVLMFIYLFVSSTVLKDNRDFFVKSMVLLGLVLGIYGIYKFYWLSDPRGTMSNKNLWSEALFLLLVFCVWSVFSYRRFFRYAGLAASLILLFNIAILMTRSVWLAVMVSGLSVLFFRPKLLIIPALIFVVFVFSAHRLKSNPTITSLVDRITCPISLIERGQIWWPTLKMTKDNLLGVGPANWRVRIPAYHTNTDSYIGEKAFNRVYYQRTHNGFFCGISETGVIGGLFFVAIFVVAITTAKRQRNFLSFAGLIGCATIIFFSFFLERTFCPMIMLSFLALTIVHKKDYRHYSRRTIHLSSVIVLLILGVITTDFAARYQTDRFVRKIYIARKQKDWHTILKEAAKRNRLCTLCPTAMPIVFYQGEANYEIGRRKEAFENYTEALKYNPNHPYIWINLSVCYADTSELDYAMYCCEKALEIGPEIPLAKNNYVVLKTKLGNKDG